MKKRTVKKLTLNRETIHNLNDASLHKIVGGGVSGKRSCPETTCGKNCPTSLIPG